MIHIRRMSAALLLVLVCAVSCIPFGNDPDKDRLILRVISQFLEFQHYENIKIDDNLSSKAFDEYIQKLDYSKRFLLKTDIQSFEQYRYKIDDMLMNPDMQFCYMATDVIKQRQKQAQKYFEQVIEGEIDFGEDEVYQSNSDSVDFAANEQELGNVWRQMVKFAVLERYYDMRKTQEKAIKDNDTSYKRKTDAEMKADAVSRIKENYSEWFKRINSIKDDDWTAMFINSIVSACDPHSDYFPPEDKESFDISMSGKFEGIGATLQSKNGLTKVADIIPGSASWRQGELQVGDIIQMVGQGDDIPVDITNMQLDDAVKLIRGKKGSTVKLTVKKVDGTVKVIPIVRDVVIIEETYAKSAIIRAKEDGAKIGYIYLPKFYADFQDRNGRFCSKDVKAEVEKLKRENVSGIVIDLRNNGGGSLSDVIDMSGLFIESGPVVQVRTKDGETRHLDDKDPSIQYSGPMVVMVNGYSASASEILAAALQDYNRAIIMGSKSSFGKGTVQSVYDLDAVLRIKPSSPLGALKLTIQKFYRINGGTTQLQGVIPDIILPDNYSYMNIGEKEQHNALPFDNIAKASYKTWTPSYNKRKVVEQSNARIQKNPVFNQIDQNAKRLKKRADESSFPLNYDKYAAHQRQIEQESEVYSKIGKDKTGLKADFIQADRQAAEGDTVKTKKFTKWFDELEKDIYIMEAANVINDMNK